MRKKLTRRHALRALAVAGSGAAVLGLYTWRIEPHWLEFTYPVLPISGLPRELEGRTLAQLSDQHIGPKVDDDYIIESFRRTQQLAPDFVVFTGDWITYRSPRQFEQLRRVMSHAPHGRLGTIGILGNHDYGFAWRMADVADEVTRIVRASGITVLRNEALTVAGLQFLGLDDLWGLRFNPVDLLVQKGQDSSTVVLCHISMPRIARSGAATRAGFLPGTPTAASASRHFCRHRSCRYSTNATPPARSNCRGAAECTSAAA